MKKILSVILVLVMALSLSACTFLAGNETTAPDTTLPITEPPVTEPPETEPPETEPAVPKIYYRDIECTNVSEWKDLGIKWKGNDFVFVTKFPENWELAPLESEAGKTYVILREGKDIGMISTAVPKASLETLERSFYEADGVELDYEVREVKEGKGVGYRRVFGFFFDDYRVFFEIDYNEIDDKGCRYMADSIEEGKINGEAFRIPMEGGNSSRRTIVIGNSFIRTSQIGDYLKLFYDRGNKYYTLESFTRNGQSVEDYAKESWLEQYRNGTYHVVFMCGLYNSRDEANFPKVVEACKQSNTKLVIFPAHNETYNNTVEKIREKYPDIHYLGWRDEINMFIDNGGISYWDFCIDDGDKHSKPLAGYIGAHMIYTALYGEVPPEYTASAPHSISHLKSVLGESYIKTGIAPGERIYKVYELVD